MDATSDNLAGKAVKAGLWYTVCNFIVGALSILTTPIFSRILGTSDYGAYNNFASWLTILTVIATLNMSFTIARARFDYSEELDQYLSSIALLGSLITGVFYLVVVLFMPFFSSLFSLAPFYIHVLFLNLLVAPAFQLLQTRNRMFYKYKLFVVLTFVLSSTTIALALVLVNTMPDKLMGRVLGQIIPTFLLNLVIYIYLVGKGRCFKKSYCVYALKISLPYVPHALALQLLGTSDRIMIAHICGDSDAGLYSLAYTCSLCIGLLCTSLNQAMSPWLTEQLHLNNLKRIKAVNRTYISLFCALAILISFLGPELIFIFGGRSYMDAVKVMPPVFIGLVFQFAYTMNVNIEIYEKKTGGTAIGTVIAATINILLNIIFIPMFGYVAAAYTTLVGYVVLYLIHFYIVHRIGRGTVYDNKQIILVLIGTSVIMAAISFLYPYYVIKYICFIVVAILILLYGLKHRELISGLLRRKN